MSGTFDALRPRVTELRRLATDVDDTRTLDPAVTEILREAGLFRMLAPRSLGGEEADPVAFFDVIEDLSFADGSIGWIAMLTGCYATFGGMLPALGAKEIFGDSQTIAAGAFNPNGGTAIEVDGGYRVTGRWILGSGSNHANWFIGGAAVVRDGSPVLLPSGAPAAREFFFPCSQVTIFDTWNSTGLRGTASNDYAVDDVFVPHHRTLWFQEAPCELGPLYRMPPIAMFATFIGAVPLGIARHAIEAFVALAATKTQARSTAVLADNPSAQAVLGEAQAKVAAGHRHLRHTLREVWAIVDAGGVASLADRGRLWTAATHAGHASLEAVDALYTAAGAAAIFSSSPLDRCLRDARTAVQHVCLQRRNYELAGRQLTERDTRTSPWGIDCRDGA